MHIQAKSSYIWKFTDKPQFLNTHGEILDFYIGKYYYFFFHVYVLLIEVWAMYIPKSMKNFLADGPAVSVFLFCLTIFLFLTQIPAGVYLRLEEFLD